MEILKSLYFLLLGIYILQCYLARKIKLNWILVLIAVAIHASYFFGWQGIVFLLAIGIISTIAELISLKTPLNVFGVSYRYDLSNKFFPSKIVLAGVYPIEVTAVWILLKYLSFFLVSIVFLQLGINGIAKAVVSALALVSFDFLLDPFAVSRGTWKWERPGIFFGIPWQNFLGWFLVGFVISFIFMNLEITKIHETSMVIPILVVYTMLPLIIGRKLISIDKIKGILATLPIILFLISGLYWFFT